MQAGVAVDLDVAEQRQRRHLGGLRQVGQQVLHAVVLEDDLLPELLDGDLQLEAEATTRRRDDAHDVATVRGG